MSGKNTEYKKVTTITCKNFSSQGNSIIENSSRGSLMKILQSPEGYPSIA